MGFPDFVHVFFLFLSSFSPFILSFGGGPVCIFTPIHISGFVLYLLGMGVLCFVFRDMCGQQGVVFFFFFSFFLISINIRSVLVRCVCYFVI